MKTIFCLLSVTLCIIVIPALSFSDDIDNSAPKNGHVFTNQDVEKYQYLVPPPETPQEKRARQAREKEETQRGQEEAHMSSDDRNRLNELFNSMMSEASNSEKWPDLVACYQCAAEVIQQVLSSNKPVNNDFFKIMNKISGSKNYPDMFMGRVRSAAILQGVSTDSGACFTATFHSK